MGKMRKVLRGLFSLVMSLTISSPPFYKDRE